MKRTESVYVRGAPTREARLGRSQRAYARLRGYRVVSISLYEEDLRALDAKVDSLRARGASVDRSKFIRAAVAAMSEGDYVWRSSGG